MLNFGLQYRVRTSNRREFLNRFLIATESLAADRKAGIRLWQCGDDPSCLLITNDCDDQLTFTNFLRGQGLIESEPPASVAIAARIPSRPSAETTEAASRPALVNFVEPYYFDREAA